MPLPTDQVLLDLSEGLLKQFEAIFGQHPGFRPAHAKGILLTGTFTPSPHATTLTSAPHAATQTSISVRFSNSTGVPLIPDSDPNTDPRGMAVRFHLGDRAHTDVIAHSTDGFPTRTGAEFLEMLKAIAATTPGAPSPTPIESFLGANPTALAFVQTPKPAPSSFARQTYFGVSALHFTNAAGETRFGRYRILPEAGNDFLDQTALQGKSPNFLFDEIQSRIAASPVTFKLVVQIAEPGDIVDNATIHWPESRTLFDFGTLTLNALAEDSPAEQQRIIFDPIPRVQGIEPSDDPLFELRAAVYLISGRRRRNAPPTGSPK